MVPDAPNVKEGILGCIHLPSCSEWPTALLVIQVSLDLRASWEIPSFGREETALERTTDDVATLG